jgi:hypothetical protein
VIGEKATLIMTRKSVKVISQHRITSSLFIDKQEEAYLSQYKTFFEMIQTRDNIDHLTNTLSTLQIIEQGFSKPFAEHIFSERAL